MDLRQEVSSLPRCRPHLPPGEPRPGHASPRSVRQPDTRPPGRDLQARGPAQSAAGLPAQRRHTRDRRRRVQGHAHTHRGRPLRQPPDEPRDPHLHGQRAAQAPRLERQSPEALEGQSVPPAAASEEPRAAEVLARRGARARVPEAASARDAQVSTTLYIYMCVCVCVYVLRDV